MNPQQIIVNDSLIYKKKVQEIIEFQDLDYILGIKNNGLNFLLEIYQVLTKFERGFIPNTVHSIDSYKQIKRYLSVYLSIYLTSGSFCKKTSVNYYKNLDAFKIIWNNNLIFLEEYLINTPSQFRLKIM
jgi:hypothetical protein